jgi:hypothetical protein
MKRYPAEIKAVVSAVSIYVLLKYRTNKTYNFASPILNEDINPVEMIIWSCATNINWLY